MVLQLPDLVIKMVLSEADLASLPESFEPIQIYKPVLTLNRLAKEPDSIEKMPTFHSNISNILISFNIPSRTSLIKHSCIPQAP